MGLLSSCSLLIPGGCCNAWRGHSGAAFQRILAMKRTKRTTESSGTRESVICFCLSRTACYIIVITSRLLWRMGLGWGTAGSRCRRTPLPPYIPVRGKGCTATLYITGAVISVASAKPFPYMPPGRDAAATRRQRRVPRGRVRSTAAAWPCRPLENLPALPVVTLILLS